MRRTAMGCLVPQPTPASFERRTQQFKGSSDRASALWVRLRASPRKLKSAGNVARGLCTRSMAMNKISMEAPTLEMKP